MFESIVIALDTIRSNKIRAKLTILNITVNILIITIISATMHNINTNISKNITAAKPTTFFLTR